MFESMGGGGGMGIKENSILYNLFVTRCHNHLTTKYYRIAISSSDPIIFGYTLFFIVTEKKLQYYITDRLMTLRQPLLQQIQLEH